MADTPALTTCLDSATGRNDWLPLSPFYALHYHFGMLLGTDDFETEQGYHRAKMRLHNAWLHREGVVWGFDVKLDQPHNEIRVTPGLALDAAGHELHLEADACINVGAWYEKYRDDYKLPAADGQGKVSPFAAHVVIRFKACLTRQVPALLEPCNDANTSTAYSRVFETIEILLRPGQAPARSYPYHRLRLLFGLDQPRKKKDSTDNTPEDQAVLDKIAAIRAMPAADQPAAWQAAFHQFAALDVIELRPATSEDGARTLLFPGQEDAAVVLADVTNLQLTKSGTGWQVSGGSIDVAVRPTHIATTAMQDFLAALLSAKTA